MKRVVSLFLVVFLSCWSIWASVPEKLARAVGEDVAVCYFVEAVVFSDLEGKTIRLLLSRIPMDQAMKKAGLKREIDDEVERLSRLYPEPDKENSSWGHSWKPPFSGHRQLLDQLWFKYNTIKGEESWHIVDTKFFRAVSCGAILSVELISAQSAK